MKSTKNNSSRRITSKRIVNKAVARKIKPANSEKPQQPSRKEAHCLRATKTLVSKVKKVLHEGETLTAFVEEALTLVYEARKKKELAKLARINSKKAS